MEILTFVAVAVIAVVAGWAAIRLAIAIVRAIFTGAVLFLAWALDLGFIGIAAFAACWFFLLPLTLIVCGIVGGGAMRVWSKDERKKREIALTRKRLGLDEPAEQEPQGDPTPRASTAHMIREPADVWKALRARRESITPENS